MPRNYWRMPLHSDTKVRHLALDLARKRGRLALGWGKLRDLRQISSGECIRESLTKEFRLAYPDQEGISSATPSLWNFYCEMKIGDIVIVDNNARKEIVTFEIQGDYEWTQDENSMQGDYWHHRAAAELRSYRACRMTGNWTMAPFENQRWSVARVLLTANSKIDQ
jgi:hypothetical protein